MENEAESTSDYQYILDTEETEDTQEGVQNEHMTCNEIIETMIKIWHNQLLAPDLLIHRYEVVDAIFEVLEQEKEKINQMSAEYERKPKPVQFALRKMEILRIQYMVKSYVNKRLQLIEENPLHYLNMDTKLRTEGEEELMDNRERNHCKKFIDLYDSHLESEVLSDLKGPFSSKPVAPKKPECARVIVKVVDESVKHFEIPDYSMPGANLFYDVEVNSIHALPWSVVYDFVNTGTVDLM
uniref:DNA replication complex GINS protein SLD5 n=1 Tax=Strongyloides papillosus TaxID=174720 RepID=A0A0N5BGB7_STREA